MKHYSLLFFLFLNFHIKADIINIPRKDVENIKYLFEDLIETHDFGYTIFGSKPMSLADYDLTMPEGLPIHRWLRSRYLLMKRKAALNAWYKYKNEFALNDFIFLDTERDLITCLALILINKRNMLNILHQYEALFKQELGDSFSPESFLEKLENGEISFAKATCKSQRLRGILLGYGIQNATLFQERYNLRNEISKRKYENLPEEEMIRQKLDTVEAQMGCFSELEADALIHPLYFAADLSHPETIALQKKYEEERHQIIEKRKKNSFMDLVLHRLVTAE